MTGTDHGAATRTPRRPSRQRALVSDFLAGQQTFVTAQQIHADLRNAGQQVGLATVYRALQSMADDGEVDVLRTDDGEQSYRRCGLATHHHHIVCRSCGFAVEVTDEPVARWAEAVAADHGFSSIEHRVEVFGTCRDCRSGR